MLLDPAGRQGRQPIGATAPPARTRSRWSLDFAKNFSIFKVSRTGRRGLLGRRLRADYLGATEKPAGGSEVCWARLRTSSFGSLRDGAASRCRAWTYGPSEAATRHPPQVLCSTKVGGFALKPSLITACTQYLDFVIVQKWRPNGPIWPFLDAPCGLLGGLLGSNGSKKSGVQVGDAQPARPGTGVEASPTQ